MKCCLTHNVVFGQLFSQFGNHLGNKNIHKLSNHILLNVFIKRLGKETLKNLMYELFVCK